MAGSKCNLSIFVFFISFLLSPLILSAAGTQSDIPEGLEGIWDSAKYISLDEISAGMDAYCLTEYGTSGIEMFGMQVIDVVRNIEIDGNRDVFLVKGTDERFIRTGPVAGCSGSPVYIDGRMAGALAYTWSYSKEPLYAATPIENMLRIDLPRQSRSTLQVSGGTNPKAAMTGLIDLDKIAENYKSSLAVLSSGSSGLSPLPFPVIGTGITPEVGRQMQTIAEPYGFMFVAGGALSGGAGLSGGDSRELKLAPGACLGVPLVDGDIKISAIGTVTEVKGNKVYGFGHPLIGSGPLDLPMATGRVHTVISNISTSFKLASIEQTVGAFTLDEATGIIGQIGKEAKTIPLFIKVDNYNDNKERQYSCRLINHKLLSPSYLQLAIAAAGYHAGTLASENKVEYAMTFKLKDYEPITCKNVSTDIGFTDVYSEAISVLSLLMDNPYEQAEVESIECEIVALPESISSSIWSVDLSETVAQPGQEIQISTILEGFLSGKRKFQTSLKIPENLVPGKYDVIVCGAVEYERFLSRHVPYRFVAQNMPGLVVALNNALAVPRDKLFCILLLPPSGIAVEESELPDLPATKAMILQDTKRTVTVRPYQPWLEQRIQTDLVVSGQKTIQITVEEKNN